MRVVWVGCAILSYLFFFQIYPNYVNPNELSRLLLVSAIVDDHTFCIEKAIGRYGDVQDKSIYNKHLYSNKAFGYSLLAIPAYILAQRVLPVKETNLMLWFLRIWLNLVPLALFTFFLYRYLARTMKLNEQTYLLIAAWLFGTLVYPYAQSFSSHLLTGLCWFLAFYFVTVHQEQKYFFLAGSILGLSFLLEFPSAVMIPVFFVWVVLRRPACLIAFSAGAALLCLPNFLYNEAVFGGILHWPYRYTVDPMLQVGHSQGYVGFRIPSLSALWGLSLSSNRGFFFYMPHLLFGLYGLLLNWRRNIEARLALCIVVLNFLLYSGYYFWDGGWSFGPRFLVPMVPFVLYGCFLWFGDLKIQPKPFLLYLYLVLLAVSIMIMLLGTATYPLTPRFLPIPVFWENIPMFWRGFFGSNLGQALGLPEIGVQIVSILLVFTSSCILVFLAFGRSRPFLAFSATLLFLFALTGAAQPLISRRADAKQCFAIARVGYIQGHYEKADEFLRFALERNPEPTLKNAIGRWLSLLRSRAPTTASPAVQP